MITPTFLGTSKPRNVNMEKQLKYFSWHQPSQKRWTLCYLRLFLGARFCHTFLRPESGVGFPCFFQGYQADKKSRNAIDISKLRRIEALKQQLPFWTDFGGWGCLDVSTKNRSTPDNPSGAWMPANCFLSLGNLKGPDFFLGPRYNIWAVGGCLELARFFRSIGN